MEAKQQLVKLIVELKDLRANQNCAQGFKHPLLASRRTRTKEKKTKQTNNFRPPHFAAQSFHQWQHRHHYYAKQNRTGEGGNRMKSLNSSKTFKQETTKVLNYNQRLRKQITTTRF